MASKRRPRDVRQRGSEKEEEGWRGRGESTKMEVKGR